MDPRDHLRERKRLRDVVVPSRVEACDAVDEGISSGEEEHRRLDAARAKCLTDVATVGVRQAEVDDEHIRWIGGDPREHLTARADGVDVEPLLTQAAAEDAA